MKATICSSVLVLAVALASFSIKVTAQESTTEASWGQIKSLYENELERNGERALGMPMVVEGEGPESLPAHREALSPIEREMLQLSSIRGTFQQVGDEIAGRSAKLESFGSEYEAEKHLCPPRDGMAHGLLTSEGESPAIYFYQIIDDGGSVVRHGFYTVPTTSLPSTSEAGDGNCTTVVTWWHTSCSGSRKHWNGSYSYVGWWWNDETSSLMVSYSSTTAYYRFYKDSRFRPSNTYLQYSPNTVVTRLPSGWNDKISSFRCYYWAS